MGKGCIKKAKSFTHPLIIFSISAGLFIQYLEHKTSYLPFKCANNHFCPNLMTKQKKQRKGFPSHHILSITLCFQFFCNAVSQRNCWILNINIAFVPDKTFFFWGTGKTSKGSEELVSWDAWGAGMLPYLIAQQSDHSSGMQEIRYFPFLHAQESDPPPCVL